MPAHSSGRVRSSGSSVVSQSITASATSTAQNSAPEQRHRLRAEAPADEREQRAGGELDQRVARRDRASCRPSSGRAARASSATGMFSYQAIAWPHDGQRERGADSVSARRRLVGDAEQLGALLLPAALQHQRQAVDDDVQEAADAQPEQGQDERATAGPPATAAITAAQTTWPSLKIGRYIETTMPPISVPRMTMMNGSIRLDRPLTASSTSSS